MEVSVVIPVYNAGPFLPDSVKSALSQPEVTEVLLIEDGSTDDSLAKCRTLAALDARIKLLQHPGGRNLGAGASRNLGIRNASSAFIAFLDADDFFLPDRFAAERTIFHRHSDADGVYGAVGWKAHDALGAERFKKHFHSPLTTIRKRVDPEELFDGFMGFSQILGFGHIHLNGLTVKRDAFEKLDQLFNEELRLHQDADLILRLAYYARLYAGSISTRIAMRGVHANNRITNNPHRAHTRLRLYEAQLAWAEREGLSPMIRRKFGRDTAHQRLVTAISCKEKCKALRTLLSFPDTLKRLDSSEALITMVFGHGTVLARPALWMIRKTHTLMWRIKGGSPPKPLGTISQSVTGSDDALNRNT